MTMRRQLIEAIFADFLGAGLGKKPTTKSDLSSRVDLFERKLADRSDDAIKMAGEWFVEHAEYWPSIKEFTDRADTLSGRKVEEEPGFTIPDAVMTLTEDEHGARIVRTGSKRTCIACKTPYLPIGSDPKFAEMWRKGECSWQEAHRLAKANEDRFDEHGNDPSISSNGRKPLAFPVLDLGIQEGM